MDIFSFPFPEFNFINKFKSDSRKNYCKASNLPIGCSVISKSLTPPSFLLGFNAILEFRLKPPEPMDVLFVRPLRAELSDIFLGMVLFLMGKAEALVFILLAASLDLVNNSALRAAALGLRLSVKCFID